MTNFRWFLVSKPVRPPFADGSSVLVRSLIESMSHGEVFTYFGDPAAPLREGPDDRVVDRASMGHTPSMRAKLSVLRELVRPSHRRDGLHFFFTPNAITSRVVRGLRMTGPRRPVIQTVMSADGVERMVPHLRGLDAVVTLSEHTRARLVESGLDGSRVVRIYPGVTTRAPRAGPTPRVLLYAGDLDPVTARRLITCARVLPTGEGAAWRLVVACRPKGARDAEARALLRSALSAELGSGKVELLGHVDDFDGLVRRCGCQLFAADHVRKKVDLPLTLLEGLAHGLGLLALDFKPLTEIFEVAEGRGLCVGARLPLAADETQLARAFCAALPDDATLNRWRVDAPALIAAQFSSKRLASGYQTLYRRLNDQHGQSKLLR